MRYFLALLITVMPVQVFAAGAGFPERPIRIVVPFAPGGGSDFVARVVAARLPEVVGQNGVVDNRPGAASLVATQLVANSPNDGYTLLLADTPFAVNNTLYSKPGYDPVKSFSPVTQLATTPLMFVVHPGMAATTVQEFVALARAQPGKLAMANSGSGSITHLAGTLFAVTSGIDVTTVPYKGTGPALTDLMGGQVQAIIATAPSVMPLIKSGKMRVLAVTSAKRSALAPDVPTMQEAGVKGYVVTNWYILVGAANTPAPVLAKLHRAFTQILAQRDVVDRFTAAIIEVTPSASPQELGTMISSEMARWGQVAKEARIRIE
jgi:tripartite-type tricarboxylate transporter receptor subunit TctC